MNRVRQSDNARPDRNVISGKPARVALAVPALMVGVHGVEDELVAVERVHHLRGEARMLPDDLEFLRSERLRLLEDRVWQRQLSDVVEERGHAQLVDRLL